MLCHSLAWRKLHGIDRLLRTYMPPVAVQKYYPGGWHYHDKGLSRFCFLFFTFGMTFVVNSSFSTIKLFVLFTYFAAIIHLNWDCNVGPVLDFHVLMLEQTSGLWSLSLNVLGVSTWKCSLNVLIRRDGSKSSVVIQFDLAVKSVLPTVVWVFFLHSTNGSSFIEQHKNDFLPKVLC